MSTCDCNGLNDCKSFSICSTMHSAQMQKLLHSYCLAGQDYASCRNMTMLEGYIIQQGGKLMRQIQNDFRHLTKLAYNCRRNISYV